VKCTLFHRGVVRHRTGPVPVNTLSFFSTAAPEFLFRRFTYLVRAPYNACDRIIVVTAVNLDHTGVRDYRSMR